MPRDMTTILAIDTSTDACSVAAYHDGHVEQRLEIQPRQHNQLLFPMLEEIMPAGKLEHLDALCYTSGPGSVTGLRVGCSAVQGIAFARGLRCIAVTSLACLAQGVIRQGLASDGDRMLCLIDARVGEIYFALYMIREWLAEEIQAPAIAKPEDLAAHLPDRALIAVGDGLALLSAELAGSFQACHGDLLPEARDMFPLARAALARGETVAAAEVLPLYVREEISWKKISEQGRPE